METVLPQSEQNIPDEIRDYLEFAIKIHSIVSGQLFTAFMEAPDVLVKRALRARIFSEYGMALEDLFAITFAVSQAYRKDVFKDFRDAIYGYGVKNIKELLSEHDFSELDLHKGLGFPEILFIQSELPRTPEVNKIYPAISYVLKEMKPEYHRTLPTVNKLKHAFLVVNKPPAEIIEQLGYIGNEVFVRTQQSGYTTKNVIESLPLNEDLVKHEIDNMKVIENALTNLLRVLLASFSISSGSNTNKVDGDK